MSYSIAWDLWDRSLPAGPRAGADIGGLKDEVPRCFMR